MSRARTGWLALALVLAAGGYAIGDDDQGAAGGLRLVRSDEVVRLGLVFRCRVERAVDSAEFDRGPVVVQVALEQAGRQLAADEFTLARLGQLRDGLEIALVPQAPAPSDEPAMLHVVVANPQRSAIQRLDRELTTPLRLQRALERAYRRVLDDPHGRVAPLPALWAEQAGELMASGASLRTCAFLAELAARMSAWREDQRPVPLASATLALRDPVDGSVQPLRLHLPADPAAAPLALVLGDARETPGKAAWPALPAAWLAAAQAAGVAVVEAYPAGDAAWRGVGPRRALLALAAAGQACPTLHGERVALVGVGSGAAAAIALAEQQPDRWASLTLVDAALPSPPDAADGALGGLALLQPGARPAHLVGLQVAMVGDADAGAAAWQRRLERAGGESLTGFQDPSGPAFWSAIARAVSLPAREYVVPAPGRYGPVLVEQLAAWGAAASLRVEAEAPLRLATSGIARLALAVPGPALVDGQPIRTGSAPPAPSKAAGQAQGPLSGYADAPFVVVVGTGEHAAAAADNRQLAQAFLAAWSAHAQGRPPQVDDRALGPGDFPGRNLVLIGNTRSNAVLKQLAEQDRAFPIAWDSRSLTTLGSSFLRSEHRAVALAWPHPAHDGRLLVVLDGAPAWRDQGRLRGVPLAGLPDLVVGGEHPGDPPALQKLFDNRWR
jgi:hypothetical protein